MNKGNEYSISFSYLLLAHYAIYADLFKIPQSHYAKKSLLPVSKHFQKERDKKIGVFLKVKTDNQNLHYIILIGTSRYNYKQ